MASAKTWIKFDEITKNHGTFRMGPMKSGMGITIGNALRRVLLSSLGGSAATSVVIEGVQHEFSTIPHVVEDVLDVVCNIKELVFIKHVDGPKEITIDFKGQGNLTAADIKHDA
ncbi:DNA-directed RNA polymerase subunit alpha, partial [Candidatus Marinamargulisbacteria bacterium SCGC AG-439-L15]